MNPEKSFLNRVLVQIAFSVGALITTYASAADYTLTVTGQCPGRIYIEWRGATPNRAQGVVLGARLGSTVIPSGQCAGVVLGIESNVYLVNAISTGSGSGIRSGLAGSHPCAWYLQLIESGSCRMSNPAQIP